ncbi:MAG: chromosome segregation protein SMC [Oscillospiraceae bacterium]|nr:chromosome segregation protein SMC [Oscillospiraceae bacterium]
MYLKSLELQGFKSFPDKIRLNFDKGLTAVVGPNGSGKSNISDAVRWVLGEQSSKMLRGSKMEDVIFSGTVGRKPMGFAAVTLVIDNSKNNSENNNSENRLADYGEEIAITRKYYRNGDSEFSINGKSVRLKDINELFMDTGLGNDGYSMIGQGRIAEIVSVKSTERREIFEEAAGISRFRYRKTEAERQLAHAQEKMERVQDIFTELESRLEPLKLQSEKARKFLILAKQEKKLEVSVWVQQLTELQEKIDAMQDKRLICQSEYENAERAIAQEEMKIQDGYQRMQEYAVQSEEIHAAVKLLRRESAQAQADIAVWKNDRVHSQERLRSLEERHRQDLQEQTLKSSELEQAQQNLEFIMQSLAKTKQTRNQAKQAFQQEEDQFRLAEEQNRESNQKLQEFYLKRSEMQFAIRSAQEKFGQFREEISELTQKIHADQLALRQTESAYQTAVSQKDSLQDRISEKMQEVSGLEEQAGIAGVARQKADENLRQLSFQLRDQKQRHRILTDLENHMEGFSGSVKAMMKAVKQGKIRNIFGSVAQLIRVESEFGIAIETALGASVQHLIVADELSAKAGIQFLKENKVGRATFLPLTTIKGRYLSTQDLQNLAGMPGFIAVASDLVTCEPAYRQIAENLLGKILIVENLDAGTIIARNSGYRFRIVTLDGQIINAGGSFTGGSVQKTGGMLTRKTELQTLQETIQDLAISCRDAEQQAFACSEQATQSQNALADAKQDLDELHQKLLQAQTNAERLAFPVSQIQKQIHSDQERLEFLKKQAVQTESIITDAIREQEENSEKIQFLEQSVSDAQQRRDAIEQKRERLSENYHALEIRLIQIQKDQESAQNKVNQLQSDVKKIAEREENFVRESEQYQHAIAQKIQAVAEREVFLTQTEQKISDSEQHAKSVSQKHDAENIRIRNLQDGLREYHTVKEKYSVEISRLTERQNALRSEHDEIITKLLEIHELTRSEAQQFAEPVPDQIRAKKDLADLKQKIRALGTVNVDAIAEYRDVSERHTFYAREIQDIQKSREELEKMIRDLTEEMCRIFSENFVIINQNFQEIFQELFGGGHAELILTDPEHVLTSGIEISVAPPGKVIKNLISLSGGEQSFVAIAIYFAILKLRPAPFCILDEIDAALDEANVLKYARYLRNFTDYTQFVLVTHRRSAMEEANVLYGVTMQEDGISRLLRLEQSAEAGIN